MMLGVFFSTHHFCLGFQWDEEHDILFVFILPCLGLAIGFGGDHV
jgi:hypothetical protein